MRTLTLPLKAIYFNQIKSGEKTEEYRLCTPYWAKRLFGREYDQIVLRLGYPKADDAERRLVRPWRGYTIKKLQHHHFGPHPVTVYAIDVRMPDVGINGLTEAETNATASVMGLTRRGPG